jgi:ABC-type sugar transport system ATPase subunit
MATASLQNVDRSFCRTKVIQGISVDLNQGGFMVHVGPWDCGKATLLHRPSILPKSMFSTKEPAPVRQDRP